MLIGVGNAGRGDDAAGLEVVRRAREDLPPGVRVVECEDDPLGLIDAWAGADDVIVVDAVRSGAAPGTLHRFDARDAPLPAEVFRGTSTHAFGVAEAVELARAMRRLPRHLRVYGIEGAAFVIGSGLSPAVEDAVQRLAGDAPGP